MSETPRTKVVVVLRAGLPINLSTNAAAVLAATLGSRLSLSLGPDAADASGTCFPGIITTPIPILVADAAGLADLFGKANNDGSLEVAPMTEVARRARRTRAFSRPSQRPAEPRRTSSRSASPAPTTESPD